MRISSGRLRLVGARVSQLQSGDRLANWNIYVAPRSARNPRTCRVDAGPLPGRSGLGRSCPDDSCCARSRCPARSGAWHQGRQRQNSLPSGSARTTQFRSPWPTSACRAKGEQAAELCCLIAVDGFDVQVQPVLGDLRAVRNRPEVDLERATADPDRYAVAAAPHDLPAQRPSPELREQLRVRRVDDQGNNPVLHLYVLTHRSRTQQPPSAMRFAAGSAQSGKVVHEVDAVKEASFWMRATMSSWTASAGRAPSTINIHSRPA